MKLTHDEHFKLNFNNITKILTQRLISSIKNDIIHIYLNMKYAMLIFLLWKVLNDVRQAYNYINVVKYHTAEGYLDY